MIAVLHRTDLLSFEVFDTFNILICRHNTKSLIGISKKFVSTFLVYFLHLLIEFLIIYCFSCLFDRCKCTWQVKHCGIWKECYLWCSILHDKWNISIFTTLKKLTVSSECTVWINLNLHLSMT